MFLTRAESYDLAVLVDFMVKKGIITPDNEPDYQEIVTRLHGRFDYDRWASQR